jgi:hypothetical protein
MQQLYHAIQSLGTLLWLKGQWIVWLAAADGAYGQSTGLTGGFQIGDTLPQTLPADLNTFESKLSCPGKTLSGIPTRYAALLSGDPH